MGSSSDTGNFGKVKKTLETEGGHGLGRVGDFHPFLSLNGLVQALFPGAPFHEPAGEVVNDHDLSTLDNIVFVQMVIELGNESFDNQFAEPPCAAVNTVELERLFGDQGVCGGQ